ENRRAAGARGLGVVRDRARADAHRAATEGCDRAVGGRTRAAAEGVGRARGRAVARDRRPVYCERRRSGGSRRGRGRGRARLGLGLAEVVVLPSPVAVPLRELPLMVLSCTTMWTLVRTPPPWADPSGLVPPLKMVEIELLVTAT